jgi:hypothetical protein
MFVHDHVLGMQDSGTVNPASMLGGALELSSAHVDMAVSFSDALSFLSADQRAAWAVDGPLDAKDSHASSQLHAADLYRLPVQLFRVLQVDGLAAASVAQQKADSPATPGAGHQVSHCSTLDAGRDVDLYCCDCEQDGSRLGM